MVQFSFRIPPVYKKAVYVFHLIAIVSPWASSLGWCFALLMSLGAMFCTLCFYRDLVCLDQIRRVKISNQGCWVWSKSQGWLAVNLSVLRCDSLCVGLKLHCIEQYSSSFGYSWRLWILKGMMSDVQQRNLRREIHSELSA